MCVGVLLLCRLSAIEGAAKGLSGVPPALERPALDEREQLDRSVVNA